MATEPGTGRGFAPLGGAPELARGALLGRYIVLDRLGAGGMGVVFSAYDPSLDRRVAIKVLRAPAAGEDSERRASRMLREAQAMAQVSHRNVATVHEVGVAAGRVFLCMELIEGQTLTAWLAPPRPRREILRVFLDAGRGLAAAHARGLVHRDFKPDNVLVDGEGRAVVTDFGIAALAGTSASPSGELRSPLTQALTRDGVIVGTPGYMAPEQSAGGAVDARADQYAFCVALRGALGGEAALPRWLRPLVLRGLAASPAARHPAMGSLLGALARGPWTTPRRVAAAVGAGVLAVAGIALVAGLGRGEKPCTGFAARLHGVWDVPLAEATARAFAASGRGHANDSYRRVAASLDGYTRAWVGMRTDACLATAVRREQSAELLDLRNTCLDRRLAAVGALAQLLARADGKVVDRAVPAVLALDPLDDCADSAALTAGVAPPRDALTRARVRALRGRIEQALALDRAGRLREGRALAEVVAVEARAIGYPAALGEALTALAAMRVTGDDAAAGPVLEESIIAAAEAHNDAASARNLARYLTWLGSRARHAEALVLAPVIEAAARRAGGDARLRGELDDRLGRELVDAGRYAEGETALRRALEARQRSGGNALAQLKTHTALARALNLEGKLDEARQHLELALALAQTALGPAHPNIAPIETELGTNADHRGDLDDARAHYGRALAVLHDVYGETSANVGSAVNNVAIVDARQGRFDEARAGFERALAIRERALGPEHPETVNSLHNLAGLLHENGRFDEARPLFERALALHRTVLGPDHPMVANDERGLGELLLDAHQPAAALPHLEAALAIFLAKVGADHPDVADTRGLLGECLLDLGRRAAALPHLEAAHAYGEAHPTGSAVTRARVASALARALGEGPRARALAQHARELAGERR